MGGLRERAIGVGFRRVHGADLKRARVLVGNAFCIRGRFIDALAVFVCGRFAALTRRLS